MVVTSELADGVGKGDGSKSQGTELRGSRGGEPSSGRPEKSGANVVAFGGLRPISALIALAFISVGGEAFASQVCVGEPAYTTQWNDSGGSNLGTCASYGAYASSLNSLTYGGLVASGPSGGSAFFVTPGAAYLFVNPNFTNASNVLSFTPSGSDVGITGVAPGNIAANSTDAVNGGQIFQLASGALGPLRAQFNSTTTTITATGLNAMAG
ncbi:conserved hypothetical protein, partial [Ricinus communis]